MGLCWVGKKKKEERSKEKRCDIFRVKIKNKGLA